jgi:hypothetical protein
MGALPTRPIRVLRAEIGPEITLVHARQVMPRLFSLAPILLLAAPASPAQSPEPATLQAPITHVALFKNGLAVVQRRVELPGPGRYWTVDVPDAVHGTLWLDAVVPVTARSTTRTVERPVDAAAQLDPQRDLAGRRVSVRLAGEPLTVLDGIVVAPSGVDERHAWSRTFEQSPSWWWSGLPATPPATPLPTSSGRLVLDTDEGRIYVNLHSITLMRVLDPPSVARTEETVLELNCVAADGPVSVQIGYLTKGLSYAPSYRLDIARPDVLTIAQSAVLRNELEDLHAVEVELVSGFPSMAFSHVLSPLSPLTTWATYFSQLSQTPGTGQGNRSMMAQNVASNVVAYGDTGGPAVQAANEGVDLHYRAVGTWDLAEGEAVYLPIAAAEAPYERIVEWRIPDTRDEWGRPVERQSWQPETNEESTGAWDALRFENPFEFPMTTGPAMVVAGRRFQGQRTTTWVNPGERTTIAITKALAIRTTAAEYETDSERDFVVWGGRQYRKVAVRGELQLCNHRAEPAELVIRREFSGVLTSADGEPETKLLERGVYSVNRRQELVWSLSLAPGEERVVTYDYTVLALH